VREVETMPVAPRMVSWVRDILVVGLRRGPEMPGIKVRRFKHLDIWASGGWWDNLPFFPETFPGWRCGKYRAIEIAI
jgi:hypothetical protein